MKIKSPIFIGILLALVAVTVTACSAQVNANTQDIATNIINITPTANPTLVQQAATQQTYSDPFAYCTAVGTIDTPDARYTGPKITDEIINGYKTAAGLESSSEPMDMFKQTTIWRCMDGKVYVCNFGANLPCNSKANIDKTPSQVMEDYCKANPDSESIPMSVTGHSTIYSWHCVKDVPELLDQIENVDAAGYLTQIWYPISPSTSPNPEVTPTPTLLGGSSQILFASNRGGYYDDLYVMDLSSPQVTRLTRGDSNTFPGPFYPDGRQILFTGFGLTNSYVGVMSADGTSSIDLSASPTVDDGFPAWSPDGKYIAFTSRVDGNNEIYIMNSNGENLKRITNNSADNFAPTWSPDGTMIAFISDRDNTTGVNNLYLMNANGSGIVRLTTGKEIDYGPAWSPDGTRIAFRADIDGNGDIYVINTDGSNKINLTNNPASDWAPAWSPDGSMITFQTNREGNWEIYLMNTDGSNPQNLTQNNADDQMPY